MKQCNWKSFRFPGCRPCVSLNSPLSLSNFSGADERQRAPCNYCSLGKGTKTSLSQTVRGMPAPPCFPPNVLVCFLALFKLPRDGHLRSQTEGPSSQPARSRAPFPARRTNKRALQVHVLLLWKGSTEHRFLLVNAILKVWVARDYISLGMND